MANSIDAEGSTSLDAGLNEAISTLDRNTRVQPSNEVMIFITDGNGTYTPSGYIGSPVDNANNKGYTIFSIGLNISSENELENTCKDDMLSSDETASIIYSTKILRASDHLPEGDNNESSVGYIDR